MMWIRFFIYMIVLFGFATYGLFTAFARIDSDYPVAKIGLVLISILCIIIGCFFGHKGYEVIINHEIQHGTEIETQIESDNITTDSELFYFIQI